jgi:hypothetical protein
MYVMMKSNSSSWRRLAVFLVISINAIFVREFKARSDVDLKRRQLNTPRGNIYTFYAPLLHAEDTSRERKVRKADEALLQAWKKAWYDAGWNPRIISLEDAKNHPNFILYLERLKNVTLIGIGGRGVEYNKYCFLRYLAMAHVGGGMMADYDLFPIINSTQSLRNYSFEDFTVYQRTLNKAGPVPALCSGSSKEWERIAFAILEISQNPLNTGWSDMTALMQLYKTQQGSMVLRNQVLGSNEFVNAFSLTEKCNLASRTMAIGVHFSHYDVQESGYKILDRPQLALDFMASWRKHCNQLEPPDQS